MMILEYILHVYLRELARIESWAREIGPDGLSENTAKHAMSRLFERVAHGVPFRHGPYYQLYSYGAEHIESRLALEYRQISPKWRRTVPLPPADELDQFATAVLLTRFCCAHASCGWYGQHHVRDWLRSNYPSPELAGQLTHIGRTTDPIDNLLYLVAAQCDGWTPNLVRLHSTFAVLAEDQRARQTEWVRTQAFLRQEQSNGTTKQDHHPDHTRSVH